VQVINSDADSIYDHSALNKAFWSDMVRYLPVLWHWGRELNICFCQALGAKQNVSAILVNTRACWNFSSLQCTWGYSY